MNRNDMMCNYFKFLSNIVPIGCMDGVCECVTINLYYYFRMLAFPDLRMFAFPDAEAVSAVHTVSTKGQNNF